MFSCNPTDCTNGVQDGNETGIDCGGNCPPCTTSPNGNSSQNNDYWKFRITIDGITHEAEGYGLYWNTGTINNAAYATTSISWGILCQITDPSLSSYVSGNNGQLSITINNPSIGTTMSSTYSTWFADAVELSAGAAYGYFGYSLTQGGVMEPGSDGCVGGVNLPITITDLGTAGGGLWSGGTSLKGSYSGIIYLNALGTIDDYSIPMDIDIEFEVLRQ